MSKNKKRIKIGINGFGRIGRAIFRQNINNNLFEVVAINDLNNDIGNLAYQLKYDSTHGVLKEDIIKEQNGKLIFNKNEITVFNKKFIDQVPWNELSVDIVIGCTGILQNVDRAPNCLIGSVKKVIFSDSPKNVDFTLLMGVNDHNYINEKHNIIAGSICDVVGVAPLLKILESEYGIKHGFMFTLHPCLVYQNILDGNPNTSVIKDPNGTPHAIGRASAMSLIPKSTSLVGAIEQIIPDVRGKLRAMSYRVPTDIVGNLSAIITLNRNITKDEIINTFKSNSNPPYFEYTEEPMISIDYKHHESSCVLDGKWIEISNSDTVRLVTWYDNEWGYTARFYEAVQYLSNYM